MTASKPVFVVAVSRDGTTNPQHHRAETPLLVRVRTADGTGTDPVAQAVLMPGHLESAQSAGPIRLPASVNTAYEQADHCSTARCAGR